MTASQGSNLFNSSVRFSSVSCVVVMNVVDRLKGWLQRREAKHQWFEMQDFEGRKLEVEVLGLQRKVLRKQVRELREEEAGRKEVVERESKNSYVV